MRKSKKILIPFIGVILILNSCNNKDTDSPYGDILDRAPFTGLTDSIKQQPANDELYFRRAVLLNSNDLPEPALDDFQKAWSLKKDERYALGVSTILLEKKPDSALVFINAALAALPKSLLLRLSLARAYEVKGRHDEALQACDQLLTEYPQQVDVLKMKADILDKKGDKTGTINTLQKAYALTPFDVELNYMLALKLAETGNSRVIALCDSLIKADSLTVHAEPYYYKGLYYYNVNDKAKALALFDNAIKVDYQFLDGYIEKGSLLYELKRYKEALEVLNLCLTISPKFADSYYWIAKCQEAMGDKENAKLNYQRAYGLDGDLIEAKKGAERLDKN